jgi:hypothetical protein
MYEKNYGRNHNFFYKTNEKLALFSIELFYFDFRTPFNIEKINVQNYKKNKKHKKYLNN